MKIFKKMFRSILNKLNSYSRKIPTGSGYASSGAVVSDDTAMKYSAFFGCVNNLSQTVGTLPAILYKNEEGKGRVQQRKERLYSLLKQSPNPYMTAYTWKALMINHLCFRGNHFSQIVRNTFGEVLAIAPLNPDKMEMKLSDAGEIIYVYQKVDGSKITLNNGEVFHVRGISGDGLVGISPLAYMRETLGIAIAGQEYAGTSFRNGGRPTGVLEFETELGDETYERIRKRWQDEHGGANSAGKVAILEQGTKFKAISFSKADEQLLQSREFDVAEIARYFRMPLHKLQMMTNAIKANIEEQNLEFGTDTILPWTTNIQQEMWLKLLTEKQKQTGFYIDFNFDIIQKADIKSRYSAYNIAIRTGIMSPNEARAKENLPTYKGGDIHVMQGQMVAVDEIPQK